MVTWNKVFFKRFGEAYQEVDDYGNVVQYVDIIGNSLFATPPIGDGCYVIDDDAVPSAEMASVGTVRENAMKAEVLAIKTAREAKLRFLLLETVGIITDILNDSKLMTEELDTRLQDLMKLSEF